jgi:hypothetical protein
MPEYDFSALSGYEFEALVRDLLQAEYGLKLESFSPGPDAGIDLRSSRTADGTLIVQCKNLSGSSFSTLLSKLKRSELPKIEKLQPSRYILATSQALTPAKKRQAMEAMRPYIHDSEDVIGKRDLNTLLSDHNAVEVAHFKLWLTSVPVLQRVLHSGIFARSAFEVESIQRKFRLYVDNGSFSKALKILDRLHTCVIAGIPGIGKTTLAEVLAVHHLDQDYEVVIVRSDINEAFRVLDTTRKQMFYYDDFLGQTSSADKFAKNEERDLLRFLSLVRGSENTRFVLTTREYILSQAKRLYEVLAYSDIDVHKLILDLADYTYKDRALIFYNHIHHSDLPEEVKRELCREEAYKRVVSHRNFSPRIISWMLSQPASSYGSPDSFTSEIVANLDDPIRLWRHAFDSQLDRSGRDLLYVLASFPEEVPLEFLKGAFSSFQQSGNAETRAGDIDQQFEYVLKDLLGTFVMTRNDLGRSFVTFHNPSIRDFVNGILDERAAVVARLIATATFFEQLEHLWGAAGIDQWDVIDSDGHYEWNAATGLERHLYEQKGEFLERCCALYEAEVCRFDKRDVGDGELYFRSHYNLASRLEIVIDAACVLNPANKDSSIDVVVSRFVEVVNEYDDEALEQLLNRGALLDLLDTILTEEYKLDRWRDALLQIVKDSIFMAEFRLDEFEWYGQFYSDHGASITEEEHRSMQNSFKRYLADHLEDEVDELENGSEFRNFIVSLIVTGADMEVDTLIAAKLVEAIASERGIDWRGKADTEAAQTVHQPESFDDALPEIRSIFRVVD